MEREQIKEQLNMIIRDIFDDEKIVINENTTASDVEGWDSLMHITLLEVVEDEFGMKFSMKEISGVKNVGHMIDLIENHSVR